MENIQSRIVKVYEEIRINEKGKGHGFKIYQTIHQVIKNLILCKSLPAETLLPPTRILAAGLGVSRSSVIKAYEMLTMDGLLESTQGSGHRVKNQLSPNLSTKPTVLDPSRYPAISETGRSFQKNDRILDDFGSSRLAFRPGVPPLDIFPVNQWKNLTNNYWQFVKTSSLDYSPSSGTAQLKKTLANYLNLSRNIQCDPRQIIIVSGSLQSLYLIGSILLDPGDCMTLENPTFPNVISIFKGLRANIQTAGIDSNGIQIQDLVKPEHLQSKIIHTVPSCHYPTGVRMSLERRHELLEWASRNKTIIIENDYEHDVNNHKDFLPSLFSLDQEQRTVFLGTFNRLLHPSIRLGYMVVPFYLLNSVETLLRHSHRFVTSSIQVVLSQFIEKNLLYRHIDHVIEVAEERKKIFTEVFDDSFREYLKIENSKTRSLHILAKLVPELNDRNVVDYMAKNNIIAHPYSKCFVNGKAEQGLIFGYSSVTPPIIRQKITEMKRLFQNGFNL